MRCRPHQPDVVYPALDKPGPMSPQLLTLVTLPGRHSGRLPPGPSACPPVWYHKSSSDDAPALQSGITRRPAVTGLARRSGSWQPPSVASRPQHGISPALRVFIEIRLASSVILPITENAFMVMYQLSLRHCCGIQFTKAAPSQVLFAY